MDKHRKRLIDSLVKQHQGSDFRGDVYSDETNIRISSRPESLKLVILITLWVIVMLIILLMSYRGDYFTPIPIAGLLLLARSIWLILRYQNDITINLEKNTIRVQNQFEFVRRYITPQEFNFKEVAIIEVKSVQYMRYGNLGSRINFRLENNHKCRFMEYEKYNLGNTVKNTFEQLFQSSAT